MDETSRVLVVEGSRTVRRIMRTMLSRIGLYSVDETDCGEDAFAMLEENEYAMVASDWNLGSYDGPSLLRDMRRDPIMRTTPFVMATAMSSKDFDAKAGHYDLTYYLPKPFDQRRLETIVASIRSAKAPDVAPQETVQWNRCSPEGGRVTRRDDGRGGVEREERLVASKRIVAYSDGACSGNPGPGGWGVVVTPMDAGGEAIEGYGYGGPRATNNAMEILAATRALEIVVEMGLEGPVTVRTDSEHVVKGMGGWVANWRRNGWVTASRKPVSNRERWERLAALADGRDVRFEWLRGHVGDAWNERADRLAVQGCRTPSVGERGRVGTGGTSATEDATAAGTPRTDEATVVLRVPSSLVAGLEALARGRGTDKDAVASEAIRAYLEAEGFPEAVRSASEG